MTEEQLTAIAKEYATPAYVFDIAALEEKISQIRSYLPKKTGLCFAVKANPFLIPVAWKLVDRLEVCSPGEYEICIREHVPPENIIVSGVNKSYDTMKRIFSYSKGAGIYTMESELHYEILSRCAKEEKKAIRVLLRLSSGNQFGMDEQTLLRVAKRVMSDDNMTLAGVHYYAGTQKKQSKMEKELDMLSAFAEHFRQETGAVLPELEYGAGLAVSYFENDSEKEREQSDSKKQLSALAGKLDTMQTYEQITIELGRFLASECGYFLTTVVDKKNNAGTGYLIVDGGIHQLNFYGWMMGMKRPFIRQIGKDDTGEPETWNICGSLCTVNDVLAREAVLKAPDIGDVLVFERCGAYSSTEGMAMFLCRELPQILLYNSDGSVRKLRERIETNEIQL